MRIGKTSSKFISAILMVAFLITSCSKEGSVGPKGDKGDQGDQGPAGTANVIYSDWFTIPISDWTGLDTNLAIADISSPKLTEDIIDNVTVMVYMKSYQYTIALPVTTAKRAILFAFVAGNIRLQVSATNDVVTAASIQDTQYRYVLIPGGEAARTSLSEPDLNVYHDVCQYYAIPE